MIATSMTDIAWRTIYDREKPGPKLPSNLAARYPEAAAIQKRSRQKAA